MPKGSNDNLIGQKFGKLTVIKEGERMMSGSGDTKRTWDCLCECGKTKNVISRYLKRLSTKSCGECDEN